MGAIYVLILMITAVAALLSIPILYLWAWAAGPAVKYLGRKWEEGRQLADERRVRAWEQEYGGVRPNLLLGPPIRPAEPTAAPGPAAPAAEEPRPQFTITGRQIR